MAKKLRKLKIFEVSAVQAAANPHATIKIMKRDRRRYRWGGAYNLVPVDTDDDDRVAKSDTSVERALREIEENKRFAKSHAAVTEVVPMETETEFQKAAVAKVNGRIDAIIAMSDRPISREVAIGRMASSSDERDIEAWRLHKSMAVVPPTPVIEPPQVAVSEAFMKLQRKAEKRAAKNGTRVATEFAKLYSERPDLAAQDRAFRLGGHAA